ncbi:Hypothetical protein PFR_JS7-2_1350 [Propionibacterium freudenreichii]|nr:Hypothetical protein PFR_JS7-1_1350 [Propionibacterium freudenreichii]SCQ52075.1 Hypothetical protein PFR_JS7-2_1350 [Propionibacterium freudenreichii]
MTIQPVASGSSGGSAKYASLDTHTPRLQPPLSVDKLSSHEIKNSKTALQVSDRIEAVNVSDLNREAEDPSHPDTQTKV